ncbi:MAG: hypothetical protein PVH68_09785 [Armatimonadota bacterium]|jgi:hypothetical protein
MHRLHRRRAVRAVTYFVIAALILPYCTFLAPRRAEAQAREGRVQTIALLTLVNKSRKYAGESRARAATDAVAIALEATKRFDVLPLRDVEAALEGQALRLPLDEVGMTRLGRALKVDGVVRGWVSDIRVDAKSNRATVEIRIEMLDVESEAILNGGAASRTTVSRPGITVMDDELINEAMREAAQWAIDDMVRRRIAQGTVLVVDETGEATVSLGTQEGVKAGDLLLQLRPEYRPEIEEVVKRKIGTLRVTDVNPHQCSAVRHTGPGPKREDFVRVMYKPPKVQRAGKAKRNRAKALKYVLGFAVLGAVFALATGNTRNARGPTGDVFLSQWRDGEAPSVRMIVKTPAIPRPEEVAGRVVHRGSYQGFPVDGFGQATIQDVLGGEGYVGGREVVWSDNPNDPRLVPPGQPTVLTWTNTIDYFDTEGGAWAEIDFTVDYTFRPVVAGQTYWYRLQNMTAPQPPPGTTPTAAAGRGAPQRSRLAQTRQITVPEPASVSAPSDPFGPVTYFLPAVLQSPTEGFTGASPQQIEFVWDHSVGADRYILEVFAGLGTSGQRLVGNEIPYSGQTQFRELVTFAPQLPGSSMFTWRVGARKNGEPRPRRGAARGSAIDWVFSENRTFITAAAPPPPP